MHPNTTTPAAPSMFTRPAVAVAVPAPQGAALGPVLPTYGMAELRADASPGVQIRAENGETFFIPSADEWPDEAFEAMPDNVNAVSPRSIVAMARAILGPDYERFRSAGGRAMDVWKAINRAAADQGVTPGE
ncbi:hypothetical protein [Glycomyces sp. NPDC048151]|uniref:hypothetical protein n=1 Tax=Glycomyces sp. NPDC048151 TaxID=3364002 RepID=UPI00371BE011